MTFEEFKEKYEQAINRYYQMVKNEREKRGMTPLYTEEERKARKATLDELQMVYNNFAKDARIGFNDYFNRNTQEGSKPLIIKGSYQDTPPRVETMSLEDGKYLIEGHDSDMEYRVEARFGEGHLEIIFLEDSKRGKRPTTEMKKMDCQSRKEFLAICLKLSKMSIREIRDIKEVKLLDDEIKKYGISRIKLDKPQTNNRIHPIEKAIQAEEKYKGKENDEVMPKSAMYEVKENEKAEDWSYDEKIDPEIQKLFEDDAAMVKLYEDLFVKDGALSRFPGLERDYRERLARLNLKGKTTDNPEEPRRGGRR